MKSISEVSVCVVDNGLGLPIAQRLARDCKRVCYFSEWQEGFSTIHKGVIGWGIPNVERIYDFWEIKDDIDLWVFPDIQRSGEQLELESQGRFVWGSRKADRIETNRQLFLELIAELGLKLPEFKVCEGISELRAYLKDQKDCYIKLSKFRGSLETHHWRNWKLDENYLDLLAVRFGHVRELIPFIVVQAINTPLEIGGDTYCVDGKWPMTMLHGIERKDESYFAAVTPMDEMPDQVQEVLKALAEPFRERRFRNEFSCEIRVKDDNAYFLDPTCRLGLPSTASQLELWSNYSEILWAGAHGELIDPEPTAKFSAEIILKAKCEDNLWPTVEIPKELQQWCKLGDCCEVDGVRSWPREGSDDHTAGWLVAIGDTPTETMERIKEYAALLPDGLTANVESLADVIKEIDTEEKEGIEFSGHEMPDPSIALQDA